VITKSTDGVDRNRDAGSFAGEKLRCDTKEKFVVPCRVLTSDFVDSCSELGGRIDPRECVGLKVSPW